MSRVVMKMLSPIKCLRVFLKEGTSSVLGLGERQNTGKEQQRQSRRHSAIYVERGEVALQCINKLVSVLD